MRCPFVILFFGSRILLCFVKTLRKNVLEKYCLFGSVESWFFFWKINFFFKFSVTCRKKCWFFPSSFQKKYSVMRNFCFSQFIYWVFKHLLGSWFICVIQRTCKKYYSKKILFLFCMDVIQYITILIDAQHSVFVFINCIVLCEFNGLLWSLGFAQVS